MKFTPVTPEQFPNFREAHRGRVSYPIVKAFMESGHKIAKLEREGMGKTANHLKGLLQWYCRSHNLPIKLVTRQGELYFIRQDMDDEGKIIPGWKPEDELPPEDGGAPEITDKEILHQGV